MSIKTWVTQPENKFDSFYYYDTEKLHFARIRLELGRGDGPEYNSDPGVFCEQTRYVGFVEDADDFDTENGCLWTVNKDNVIVYKAGTPHKKELSREPAPGRSTVDFSLLPGYANPQFVHIGNPIVEKKEARLPLNHAGKRVTLDMLEAIAEKLATSTNDTDLGSSIESEQQLGDRIFDLYERLTGGGVLKSTRSVATQFTEATAFFNNNVLYAGEADKEDNASYADKDGLIEFIIGTELVDDEGVMEKLNTLKKYLTALISVVTNYVNRNAADKTDVKVWAEAMSHLPFMGPSKIDTQSYTRNIKGVTIATEFVHFLLDIVAQDGSAALNRFSGFLQKQGEALKFGVESNKDFYNTITIGVCVEVMKIKNEIIYIPKIKQYKVKFDRSNTTWTGACMKVELVNIDFAYQYAVNVFDYEALEDQDTKDEFNKWIAQQRKAQIENASTFFSSEFIPKKSKLATKPIK